MNSPLDILPHNAESRAAEEVRSVSRWLIAILFASIFLQRFAIPIGPDGIAINLLVTLVGIGALALRGSLTLDPVRTVLFFLLAATVALSAAINAGAASMPSLVLFLIMYIPFMFSLGTERTEEVFQACVSAFQKMVVVLALMGILQFVMQFVVGSAIPFTFRGLLPDEILLTGFNTANPLSWDSPYFKSNGFFLVEPSTFSQYLAIAIVLELLYRGATLRLLIYGLALPTSYSGTGIILLALLTPWVMLQRRAYGAIFGAMVFGIIVIATGSMWNADALFSRVNEFGSENSSANARFVAGAWLIGTFLFDSARDVVFGLGPGSYAQHAKIVTYEAHDPAWAKMLFEYGLIGSMIFWPYFLIALFRDTFSRWISWAMLIGFFTFGGMLLDPRLQVLLLLFCVLTKRPARAPALQQENQDWLPPLNIRPAS
ncbi:hypothetical protein ACFOD4_13000 [Pseudoroseomonas globiformis]|uniref:O-antigen ligase domain-containing protein n=1 Tax=Teichococcus globiformis TaxID=2307229 RepID=A0ABV7G464_9PROT